MLDPRLPLRAAAFKWSSLRTFSRAVAASQGFTRFTGSPLAVILSKVAASIRFLSSANIVSDLRTSVVKIDCCCANRLVDRHAVSG